jgi:hypothetical protein
MKIASNRPKGVHVERVSERQRQPVPALLTNREGRREGAARSAEVSRLEASLHEQYAELRASGLACDRW